MAAETQYTPQTGMQTIATANSNLDGTGTLSSAIITGASNGTLIKTVTIKAITNTTDGMVRLFVTSGGKNPSLIREINIPAVTKSATDPAFQITFPLNLKLASGKSLYASTEKAETFNIIAEAQDWSYYAASVRAESTKYTFYNAGATISTANSNLDGTGTLGTPLVSSGCNLMGLTIKAGGNTTAGMIRVFLYCNSPAATKLFLEIPVQAIRQTDTNPSFYYKVVFENGFALKSGWQIKVSTENAETFYITPESLDWSYPA